MKDLEIVRRRLWTPRPEVTMDNYQEVFDFYDKYGGPNPKMARFGHFLFGHLYPVRVEIAPNDAETINNALGRGALAFLMMNHATKHDQFNLASTVQRTPALHRMRARSVIMARYGLFNEPGFAGQLQRLGIDAMGSLPAFRSKDAEGGDDSPERRKQRRASASTRQLGMNKTARDGFNMVGYPENQRLQDGDDPTIIRKLSSGFGMMYENIGDDRERIVITASHFSGEGEDIDVRHAAIKIGPPITRQLSSTAEFTDAVAYNLQRDLTGAVDLWERSRAA